MRATLLTACLAILAYSPCRLSAQGETTSAIVGAVVDPSGAVLAGATVTVVNVDTGSKRSANTDESGRFSFPQLKPGPYHVKVEAAGFEPQTNDSVFAGLGQKQTVNFTLDIVAAKGEVTVTAEAPLLNPENPNTATVLNAKGLEDLPNPGGDMTYPLQFAAGALINTAGSGNDFVGGTNGYGNVQFNGLPSLSNGYIVDGLETNDPLTNLNSGLSTNLVLGLNSIAEVTVNTLSYAVDQGRYGASQVNYVTKSGTNQFHGNLYELWNGSRFNAANFFTNSTPGNHKPRSTVNHFGGSLGGPILRNKLFFFFDSEWVRIAFPSSPPRRSPRRLFRTTSCNNFRGRNGFCHRIHLSAYAAIGAASTRRCSALYRRYGGNSSLCSWLPVQQRRQLGSRAIRPTAMVARTARAFRNRAPTPSRSRPAAWTTTSTRTIPLGSVFSTTADCRPPILTQSIRCSTQYRPQPLYSFASGYTHVFSPTAGELLQSGVFLV